MYNEQMALEEAVSIAGYSKCKSQRGVVIFSRSMGLLSTGYNRPPKPLVCDGSDKCRATCAKTAIHAEQAALLNAFGSFFKQYKLEMLHVKIVNGVAVPSLQPSCWQCSKLILEAGVDSMWLFLEEGLKCYTALEFHNETLKNCELL